MRDGSAHVLRCLKVWYDLPSDVFHTALANIDTFLAKMKVNILMTFYTFMLPSFQINHSIIKDTCSPACTLHAIRLCLSFGKIVCLMNPAAG